MSSRPAHTLRVHRKRSGLSQREVGVLLGVKGSGKVSRYERGHRLPPLPTALAYATILDVPVAALFPDLQSEVEKEVAARAEKLRATLPAAQAKKRGFARAACIAQWLDERCGSKITTPVP